jgi:hypothetical protein
MNGSPSDVKISAGYSEVPPKRRELRPRHSARREHGCSLLLPLIAAAARADSWFSLLRWRSLRLGVVHPDINRAPRALCLKNAKPSTQKTTICHAKRKVLVRTA